MIKAIIFDYDGVIADSLGTAYKIYNSLARRIRKKKFRSKKQIGEVFNGNWLALYRYIGITEKEDRKAAEIHRQEYEKVKGSIKFFAGIKEIVKKLSKNYKLAIVSSNYKEYIKEMLKKNELEKYFMFIIDCNDVKNQKPNPDQLLLALKKLRLKSSEVIYIGDTDGDVIAGKKAKIKTIAVTYGWQSREKLEKLKPDFVVNGPKEILKTIGKTKLH